MVALYFLKPAATFTDCSVCYARQTTGMRSRPSSSGWKQFMQAPGRRRGWLSLGGRPPLVGIRLAAAGSKLARPYFLEAGGGTCSSCTLSPDGSPSFPEAGRDLYMLQPLLCIAGSKNAQWPFFLGLNAIDACPIARRLSSLDSAVGRHRAERCRWKRDLSVRL